MEAIQEVQNGKNGHVKDPKTEALRHATAWLKAEAQRLETEAERLLGLATEIEQELAPDDSSTGLCENSSNSQAAPDYSDLKAVVYAFGSENKRLRPNQIAGRSGLPLSTVQAVIGAHPKVFQRVGPGWIGVNQKAVASLSGE